MRSLYTQDIEGTRSKPTIFDKGYYKQKHLDQVRRSPRNPDKSNQYEWFTPLPKASPPDCSPQPYCNTIKLISQHTGLNHSMHYQSLKKDNNPSLPPSHSRMNHSVLSNSGASLLAKKQVDQGENPYYPHRIRQMYDQSSSTRFTGNRNWNSSPTEALRLPDPKSEYVSKWVRI